MFEFKRRISIGDAPPWRKPCRGHAPLDARNKTGW
jgi:hypothetical protein